jgi:plastocyanin
MTQVQGIEDLPPGTHEFYCSLHGAMQGVLEIFPAQ